MGWRFRKSVKVFPGVRVNLGKDGISGVSAGVRGARVSVNKRGVRQTVSIPGSGLSYSEFQPHQRRPVHVQPQQSKAWAICKALILIPLIAIGLIAGAVLLGVLFG